MELKAQTYRAEDAKAVLNNPAWKMAWEALNAHMDQKLSLCDTVNREKAADVVRCKQLLSAIEREFHRIIESGQVAEMQILEEEKKKSFLHRVFVR